MPRSVLLSSQHEKFLRFKKPEVKLGKICHEKTEEILLTLNYKSTGKIRSVVRKQLDNEYQKIDDIVLELFKK